MADQYPQDKKHGYVPQDASNPPPGPPPYIDHTEVPPPLENPPQHRQPQCSTVYPPGASSSSSAAAQQSATRTLHVYHASMLSKQTQILDSDKTTPLYNIEIHTMSKPHVTVHSATNPARVIGTATFHHFSSRIDVVVHGHAITLESRGPFKSGCKYVSPAAQGASRVWKSEGVFSGSDMVCLDGREQIVARFEASTWAVKKAGKFDLGPSVRENGPAMDEVVVVGVAMLEDRRRKNSGSSGGAGGGGAGA